MVEEDCRIISQVQIVPLKEESSVSEMEEEIIGEKEEPSAASHSYSLNSIDSVIHVPGSEKVIVVDLTNGLFVAEKDRFGAAVLRPFFDLEVEMF